MEPHWTHRMRGTAGCRRLEYGDKSRCAQGARDTCGPCHQLQQHRHAILENSSASCLLWRWRVARALLMPTG